MAVEPRKSTWRNGNYTWWLAGDTTGAIGRGFSLFIVSFVAYDLSGSEAIAGSINTVILLVMLFFSVPGGVITDRSDRRTLVYLYSGVGAVISLFLFALVLMGKLNMGVFIAFMCILGVAVGFFGEASNASLRSIVQGVDYVHAQAANQGRDAAVQLATRPLAGLFYGIAAWLPYLLSGIMFAFQGLFFTRIKKSLKASDETAASDARSSDAETSLCDENSGDQELDIDSLDPESPVGFEGEPAMDGEHLFVGMGHVEAEKQNASRPRRGWLSSMKDEFVEGLRYLVGRPTLLTLGIIVTIINLGTAGITAAITLSLIGRGYAAIEVGYVGVAVGVAVIISSIFAGKIAATHPTGIITIIGLGWCAVSNVPMIFSDSYVMMLMCSFLFGLGMPIINAALIAYIFGRTPEGLQGRVGTVVNLAASGLAALAPLIAGVLVEQVDFRATCAVFVAVCAISFAIALFSARIRNIPVPSDWEQYE